MRKVLACLLAAALVWPAGLCRAMGDIHSSGSGQAFGARGTAPGVGLTVEQQLRQIGLRADSPGDLADFFAQSMSPAAPPEQADASLALASVLVHPEIASGLNQALLGAHGQEDARLAQALLRLNISDEARLAVAGVVRGLGLKLLGSPDAVLPQLRGSGRAAVSKLAAAVEQPSEVLFDQARLKTEITVPAAERGLEHAPPAASRLLPSQARDSGGGYEIAQVPTPSHLNFLRGIFSSSLGQAFNTSLLANLAFSDYGAGFAAVVMAVQLGSTILGGWVGTWWGHKFGSKSVYLRMTPLYAAGLFSLLLAHRWLGGVPRAHYVAFASMAEIIYGAQRGVAEQDITAQMVGRDERVLERANATNASWISLAYILGSGFIALLLPVVGPMPLLAIGALVMLPSLHFYSRIDLPFKRGETDAGMGKPAPRSPSQFLPYIFFWGMYLMFYGVTPLLALEALHWPAGTAWSLLAYEFGVQMGARLPFFNRLSRRWNTILAAAATSSFFLTTLWWRNPFLYLALTGALGAFLVSGLGKWKAFYQNILPESQRPAFFRWLNDWSIIAALLPFAVSCVNFFFPVMPMIPLLWAQAGLVTIASAILAGLSYRGSAGPDRLKSENDRAEHAGPN